MKKQGWGRIIHIASAHALHAVVPSNFQRSVASLEANHVGMMRWQIAYRQSFYIGVTDEYAHVTYRGTQLNVGPGIDRDRIARGIHAMTRELLAQFNKAVLHRFAEALDRPAVGAVDIAPGRDVS